jgi:tRNA pseudouridine55 synthase
MTTTPEGILLVDKPVGISSFDVIRRLRKTRGVKKMGHAGTLDPLASGLMIVAEGKATKLLAQFLKLPKTYEAEVCVGESSTTGDREGEIVTRKQVVGCGEEDIRNALAGMVGTLELPVPAYSAIKQGGVPLYKKARRGEQVETPVRAMTVRAATYCGVRRQDDTVFIDVVFDVESGVYIRSLAEELGKRLGYPARLENLRRTQVGEWQVEDENVLLLSAQHGLETTPGRLPKS